MFALAPKRPPEEVSDVCLLAEGCYPHVAGGVSTWVDWLMRSCPETSFSAVSIVTSLDDRRPRYDFPDNLVSISELVVDDRRSEVGWRYGAPSQSAEELASIICRFILEGSLDDFASIVRIANDGDAPLSLARLTDSAFAWQLCVASYRILMPQASFKGFFWAWQALTGGLFAVVKADIPRARTYHALSTGYAGLLAARARIEGAEQVLLTEHGIYTNERQIEILTADWITDTIDKGLAGHQDRLDLRDLWTVTFRSFARACYAACDRIITLFDGNQAMQRELGVPTHKLSIIPNGIDVDRFDAIPLLPDDALPAVALIGRVVPIKDVETFLRAAALVHAELPDARFIVAGSAEETPAVCGQLPKNGRATRFGRCGYLHRPDRDRHAAEPVPCGCAHQRERRPAAQHPRSRRCRIALRSDECGGLPGTPAWNWKGRRCAAWWLRRGSHGLRCHCRPHRSPAARFGFETAARQQPETARDLPLPGGGCRGRIP